MGLCSGFFHFDDLSHVGWITFIKPSICPQDVASASASMQLSGTGQRLSFTALTGRLSSDLKPTF